MARLLSLAVAAILAATAASAAGAAAAQPAQPAAQAVELVEAIHGGLLRAEGWSLGFTSGDTVVLALTNLGPKPLSVRVAPGTVLAPDDAGATPVAIRRLSGKTLGGDKLEVVEGIELAPGRTERYTFQAYSMDFKRRDPAARARLTPTALNPVLAALFRRADDGDFGPETVQAAVWLETGGVTEERLAQRLKIGRLQILDARDLVRQADAEAGQVKP